MNTECRTTKVNLQTMSEAHLASQFCLDVLVEDSNYMIEDDEFETV